MFMTRKVKERLRYARFIVGTPSHVAIRSNAKTNIKTITEKYYH